MPGPIAHLIVEQRLPQYLRRHGGDPGGQYAQLLEADPSSPYGGFGSQGPDFLTFSLNEYEGDAHVFVNFMFGIYDAMRPLIDVYENTIGPIEAELLEAIDDIDVFRKLFDQARAVVEQLNATAITAVQATITSRVDLFYPFYPKIQKGLDEDKWMWFDTLHYRRTGDFASELWKMAQGNADLERYALGYASHIGADVAVHPYVNSLVGGPYRMHWHRHHLIENWIDADLRASIIELPSTHKALNLQPGDRYDADAVSGSYYYRLCEFPDGKLPSDLTDLLVRAMLSTYSGIKHPPFPTHDDLDTTYRLWLRWFEYATSIGDMPRPTPVARPGTAADDLFNDLVENMPSVPIGPLGGFNIEGFFEAALQFLEDLGEAIVYVIEWAVDHAEEIVNLPFETAKEIVSWLIYEIHLGLWKLYDQLRFNVLVLGGYASPEPRDLSKQPWAPAFLDIRHVDLTGGGSADFTQYPHRHDETHGLIGTTEHHLRYPGTATEFPRTEQAPMPFEGIPASEVLTGEFPYDDYIEELYDVTSPFGTADDGTHDINQETWDSPQFGSGLCFSARLIAERIENLPNFNLDGDRGYGWLTWQPIENQDIENAVQVDAEYVDA